MKRVAPACVAASLILASPLTAQQGGPAHAPDFRAAPRIAPLYFPPKPNAPFMAIAKTTWVRTLPDKSTVTTQNERVVARDMEGRIFQERRSFVPVPDVDNQQSRVVATEYDDPVEHVRYTCNPNMRTCELYHYYAPMTDAAVTPAGLQPDKYSYVTRENLGTDTFAGVEVQRSRDTTTLYQQTIGNTRTILRTVDYWYSPELGVNVQVKRHDPRDGDQTLWLTDLSLTAAAPETFKPPAEYRIIDHRGGRGEGIGNRGGTDP